jgi:hypothetical protein
LCSCFAGFGRGGDAPSAPFRAPRPRFVVPFRSASADRSDAASSGHPSREQRGRLLAASVVASRSHRSRGTPSGVFEWNAPAASVVGVDRWGARTPSPRSLVRSAFVSRGDVVAWRVPSGGNTGRHRGARPAWSRGFGQRIGLARWRERSAVHGSRCGFGAQVCVVFGSRSRSGLWLRRPSGRPGRSLRRVHGLAARRAGSPARWTSSHGLHRYRAARSGDAAVRMTGIGPPGSFAASSPMEARTSVRGTNRWVGACSDAVEPSRLASVVRKRRRSVDPWSWSCWRRRRRDRSRRIG